ncbi:MAG: hypothetical protein JWN40_1446 [Phycisphaerales bacterium]|nr:hypothetical protein [Phycisphaerales bacterium]
MPDEPKKSIALLPHLRNMLAEAKQIARQKENEIRRCQSAAADPLRRRDLEMHMDVGESPPPHRLVLKLE